MTKMVRVGGGYVADIIPNTIRGIQERIEMSAQEQFIEWAVPELFFWVLGLEYISDDKITFEVK